MVLNSNSLIYPQYVLTVFFFHCQFRAHSQYARFSNKQSISEKKKEICLCQHLTKVDSEVPVTACHGKYA